MGKTYSWPERHFYKLKTPVLLAKPNKFVLKLKVTVFNETKDNIIKRILNYKKEEMYRYTRIQVLGKIKVSNLTGLYSCVEIYFNIYVLQLFMAYYTYL